MRNSRRHDGDPGLLDIARSMSDGAQIDWDTLESSAPRRQKRLIHQLRVISQVAGSHLDGLSPLDAIESESFLSDIDSFPHSWGTLEIIEPIGTGAFGEVFRARDTRLEREVALKFFHPDRVGPFRGTSDLIAEGRLLARIHHPNVVTIFGAEHHEGRAGIWMELVRGSTLEAILAEQGPLDPEETMRIGRDVCRGLAALQEAGIIHRDIKTKNIMREDNGRVVLMDLGVSCEVDSQVPVKQYGTPLYAAPEVLIRSESTDRSDIYSVGVLLFHLITGDYPVLGNTPEDLREAHKNHRGRKLQDLRPDLPGSFVRIVERALAPDPGQRFASAGQMEQAIGSALDDKAHDADSPGRGISWFRPLNIFVIASVVALLVALIALYISRGHDASNAIFPEDQTMLAILPFENLGDPEDAYFADGITDEILTKLSTIPKLGVIARESAFKYRGNEHSIEEIGHQLGVDYILKGTIRWQRTEDGSSRIRLTARLVSVADNRDLWAETYEEPLDQVFAVQASIGNMIADAMNITLLEASRQALNDVATRNLEAYDYYIRAKELWANITYGEKELPLIAELFLKAIDLDPDFALAYAMLSLIHSDFYFFNIDRSTQRLEMARSAYEKALTLHPDLPEAYLAKSLYYYYAQSDNAQSNEAFAKAFSLRPNDWLIIFYKGVDCKCKGSFEEAITWLQRAQILDPANPTSLVEEAICYTCTGKFEESERVCNHIRSLWPDHAFPYRHLTLLSVIRDGNTELARQILQASSGLVDEARLLGQWRWVYALDREFEKALEVTEGYSDGYLSGVLKYLTQATLYYFLGRQAEMTARADSARAILEKKVQAQPDDSFWHQHLGRAYAFLNRNEEAIREMRIAFALMPASKNTVVSAEILYSWAAVYVVVGEYDAAMDHLEYLLSTPTYVTKPRLRIAPIWDPLRDHPRFQKLVN